MGAVPLICFELDNDVGVQLRLLQLVKLQCTDKLHLSILSNHFYRNTGSSARYSYVEQATTAVLPLMHARCMS